MSLRLRLTIVAAAVVAVVLAAASVTVYLVMRHELFKQVDSELAQHAQDRGTVFRGISPYSGDFVTLVGANGTVAAGNVLPVDATVRAVAAGKRGGFFRNTTARDIQGDNVRLRQIVAPIPGGAVMVSRNIDYLHHDLERLRLILLFVTLGGVGVAALAGALVSRATLAPVRRLTAAAERVARTRDPSERVPETGRGELTRLGSSFNTMLAALEDALETQRQFVADASHELRTPLTSMQTNIEVLKQQERLAPDARGRLFDDLQREAHEMRDLIGGLLELARGDDPSLERQAVQLDELVSSVVERARARYPHITFDTQLEATTIDGIPDRIERAVWNLLENAGKWSDGGGTVEVTLSRGEVSVRDHGPGIEPDERERIFDRFYRATSARSQPGSGLGLAIVREVAEAHGGSVSAEEAPGGGALLRLHLTNS
ncbi:MAG TPA: HAMP domain-containing sensor histidine kinase [Gaiellaceae bacterium]|nr:HAMP domain-containing sensor histidine kinase [Gaiellaceae bacterium]